MSPQVGSCQKFVEVMQRKLWPLFFRTQCIYIYVCMYINIDVCYVQGYSVVDVFRRLCLYTTDIHVRDTLSRLTDLLTDSELDALMFIHRLETLYPHRSFETAKRLYVRHNRSL